MPPKPNAVLNVAEDLIKVGKKESALERLVEVIKNRRTKVASDRIYEDVMKKISELCIESRNSVTFKEVIHQYKNMVVTGNHKSLEELVRYFLSEANRCTEEKRDESKAKVLDDVDDLEAGLESPESLIMKAVSAEGMQERSDRTILAPWLRFLWESYRLVLDLLRNNNKFERLYHEVTHDAFNMCKSYNRKTEFRKLCDLLRFHLGKAQLQMAGDKQSYSTDLNNQDTLSLYIETRIDQLKCAMDLELYMEAFKTIEDIHNLTNLSKKSPKPAIKSMYYSTIAKIFYQSRVMVFHAATLLKYYLLLRDQKKGINQSELRDLASQVYCAILSVPLRSTKVNHGEYMIEDHITLVATKQKTLANLLSMASPPTRSILIKDMLRWNIHLQVNPEILKLFQYLEIDYHPLHIAQRCVPILDFIKKQPDLHAYYNDLKEMILSKIIIHSSQLYQTMSFSKLEAACAPIQDPKSLERCLVRLSAQMELPVRCDMRNGLITFQSNQDLGLSSRQLFTESEAGTLGSISKTILRPHTESHSGQLQNLMQSLQNVLDILAHEDITDHRNACLEKTLKAYQSSEVKHHKQLLDRKQLIENKKVHNEQMKDLKSTAERKRLDEEKRRIQEEEQARVARDREEREKKLAEKSTPSSDSQKKHSLLGQIQTLEPKGSKFFQSYTEEEYEQFSEEKLRDFFLDYRRRLIREREEKVRSMEKKIDYYQRSIRYYETPLYQTEANEAPEIARRKFEENHRVEVEMARRQHEMQLQNLQRFKRMAEDLTAFQVVLSKDAEDNYERRLEEWNEMLAAAREEKIKERKAKLVEDRKRQYKKDKKKRLEQQRLDAEAQKAREEEEAKNSAPYALKRELKPIQDGANGVYAPQLRGRDDTQRGFRSGPGQGYFGQQQRGTRKMDPGRQRPTNVLYQKKS